jgi:hypothetical protein
VPTTRQDVLDSVRAVEARLQQLAAGQWEARPEPAPGAAPTAQSVYRAQLLAIAHRLEKYVVWYDSERDSRAIFSYVYAVLTQTIADKLPDSPIDDPAWIVSYAETFAGRYLDALEAYDNGGEVPQAWDDVFQAIQSRRTSVLDDMLFPMAAHIVHDLPLVLCMIGQGGESGGSHIHDFQVMNDILGDAIEHVRDAVLERYNPYLKWLDRLGEGYFEFLSNFGLRASRGVAWYNTDRLLDPESKEDAMRSITALPGDLIHQLLDPPHLSMRVIIRLMHFVVSFGRRWPHSGRSTPYRRSQLRYS